MIMATVREKKVGKRIKEGHPWDFNLTADVFFPENKPMGKGSQRGKIKLSR